MMSVERIIVGEYDEGVYLGLPMDHAAVPKAYSLQGNRKHVHPLLALDPTMLLVTRAHRVAVVCAPKTRQKPATVSLAPPSGGGGKASSETPRSTIAAMDGQSSPKTHMWGVEVFDIKLGIGHFTGRHLAKLLRMPSKGWFHCTVAADSHRR